MTDVKETQKEKISIREERIREKKKQLRYERDKDREKVKGIFRFHEVPGGRMEFVMKAYKEDPVEKYDMVDGYMYTIPLGVAKHLNKNGWYPIHKYTTDQNGKRVSEIGSKVRRFSFQSLEFMESEDLTPIGKPEIEIVQSEMYM